MCRPAAMLLDEVTGADRVLSVVGEPTTVVKRIRHA